MNFLQKCLFLLCGGLHFQHEFSKFSVLTFRSPDLLAPTRFVADTYWRSNILPLKKKILSFLYKTRAIFLYQLFCRNLFFRRLNCTLITTHPIALTTSMLLIFKHWSVFHDSEIASVINKKYIQTPSKLLDL